MRYAKRLVGPFLCAWLSGCAHQSAMPQNSEDIEDWPLAKVLKLANQGSLVAIHHACYSYSYGRNGAPDDETQALAWCTKGHEGGVQPSTTLLAEIHYSGSKEHRDVPRARQLYREAAEAGHPFAMYMTGYIMVEEHGDLAEAMAWLRLAADRNIEQALTLLEELNETARGMPRE